MRGVRAWRNSVLLAVVGLLLTLALVWTRLQVVAVGYTLSSTRQLLRRLEGERQTLMTQWSAQTTPARLADQASRRLGMDAPQPEQVIRLR